ncbi:MAG: maltotransferase domain-containing protein, partial [Gemmatimonadales bacterium]
MAGDTLAVDAYVYRDGHDLLTGELRYRGPGEPRRRAAPMIYDAHFDRCRGTALLDRLGRWTFTVAVWTDRFGTWHAGLVKKHAAGVPSDELAADLDEGVALVREAAAHVPPRGAD